MCLCEGTEKMAIFFGGRYILRKGGDSQKGRGRFIKGGVETPLHTMQMYQKCGLYPFVFKEGFHNIEKKLTRKQMSHVIS